MWVQTQAHCACWAPGSQPLRASSIAAVAAAAKHRVKRTAAMAAAVKHSIKLRAAMIAAGKHSIRHTAAMAAAWQAMPLCLLQAYLSGVAGHHARRVHELHKHCFQQPSI